MAAAVARYPLPLWSSVALVVTYDDQTLAVSNIALENDGNTDVKISVTCHGVPVITEAASHGQASEGFSVGQFGLTLGQVAGLQLPPGWAYSLHS